MMEVRGLIREAVSRGVKSQGFIFYLADHPEDEKLHNSGQQEVAYRNFLDWLGGTLSEEIGVLFNPNDPEGASKTDMKLWNYRLRREREGHARARGTNPASRDPKTITKRP